MAQQQYRRQVTSWYKLVSADTYGTYGTVP